MRTENERPAAAEDAVATWRALAESPPQPESTTSTTPSERRCPLALHPKPIRSYEPRMYRRVSGIRPDLRAVVEALVAGVARWPLFLHGPAGVGKTCVGLCLLDHVHIGRVATSIDRKRGSYFTAHDLAIAALDAQFGRLRQERTEWEISLQIFWHEQRDADLVVLDEIGSRSRVSDSHYEAVKKLLDLREGKPLVAISNLCLQEIGDLYDDRVASRLAAGTVLRVEGEDRRLSRSNIPEARP